LKKRILLTMAILLIMTLSACNILSEDPAEENEEEIGTGEETEEESEGEEENDEEQETDDPEEEDAGEEEDDEDTDNGSDEGEDEEESAAAANLTTFYGTWEMEDEEATADTMILEVGKADAEDVVDQDEDFEYIRFGYKYSEYFPIEKIVEIEQLERENVYFIVTSYVEEEGGGGSTVEEGTGEESNYTIELVEENRLLLTYMNDEDVNEMWFTKE